jgi:hypothetical protein
MLRRFIASVLLGSLTVLLLAAKPAYQILGLELSSFPGRESLVIRVSPGVSLPAKVSMNASAPAVSFLLDDTGADNISAPRGLSLVSGVELKQEATGTRVRLTLADSKLADQQRLRVSQPSDHLIVVEVFSDTRASVAPKTQPAAHAKTPAVKSKTGTYSTASAPAEVKTLDLRKADPQRVLGLAASTGLLKLDGPSYVGTENMGEVAVKPAVQGLQSWGRSTPPGELYLSGTPEQIADFARRADLKLLGNQPTLQQVWEANRPKHGARPGGKPMAAGRGAQYRNTNGAGVYGQYTLPEFPDMEQQLSDVRINLDASQGFNLYQFLMYLSQISGISIIIDPYWFDDPTGNRPWREPLDPGLGGDEDGGPGFRPGDIFDPVAGGAGTVVGNFDNMPFDQALNMVLSTHGLVKVVYRNPSDPYAKPVIMVTSKERLEQELQGTNSVNMNQFHYADPTQVRDILGNIGELPSQTQGWYMYSGNGNGNGGGGGQGGGGGGGGQGGGQGGGGGGQGGGGGGGISGYLDTAKSGLLVYRGSSRQPIMDRVVNALDGGHVVVRVLLTPEQDGQYVTALSLP